MPEFYCHVSSKTRGELAMRALLHVRREARLHRAFMARLAEAVAVDPHEDEDVL